MPSFSVIIPLYNKEENILNTVESVLNQSFKDFEVLIVNDGSTDSSLEKVSSIEDSRIVILSKTNEGVSKTRNYGVEHATSKYVAFLDGDDIWYPFHLENLHSLISQFPDHLWFANAYEKKYQKGSTFPMFSPLMKNLNWQGAVDDFFANSYVDCLVCSSTVCMDNRFFKSLNGFDESITHGEDIDLWIRAALDAPLIFSTKISATYNLLGMSRSNAISVENRNLIDLGSYKINEQNNTSLNKYLDLNRYALSIQYKQAGFQKEAKQYAQQIDKSNLNRKQQFLLGRSTSTLNVFFKFQELLRSLGIQLTAFK